VNLRGYGRIVLTSSNSGLFCARPVFRRPRDLRLEPTPWKFYLGSGLGLMRSSDSAHSVSSAPVRRSPDNDILRTRLSSPSPTCVWHRPCP
jgi:hypothetical protein